MIEDDEITPIEMEIRANKSQTTFTITIGSSCPLGEEDLLEFLKQYIDSVESGDQSLEFFYQLIEEH